MTYILPFKCGDSFPRHNMLECIAAARRYTFAVLAVKNARETNLIRFAAPPGIDRFETMAPRQPSIKRKGSTGLNAYLFKRTLVG